jgi:hypothetical protein
MLASATTPNVLATLRQILYPKICLQIPPKRCDFSKIEFRNEQIAYVRDIADAKRREQQILDWI